MIINHDKLRLHRIAFGLTVCLAACKLIKASDNSIINNNNNSKWIPMVAPEETIKSDTRIQLELNKTRECCARLLARQDADKTGDILETAASVMAPIERVPAPSNRKIMHDQDDDQEELEDQDEEGATNNSQLLEDRPVSDKSRPNLDQPNNNNNNDNENNIDRGEVIDPGAAEQEAAEASEAEAADRSALDEQLQQQREIILAQAQSEAKAIREQQEALLRQQNLQQQMQLRSMNNYHHRPSSSMPDRRQTNSNKQQQPPTARVQSQRLPMGRRPSLSMDTAASTNHHNRMMAGHNTEESFQFPNGATQMYHHDRPSINHQFQSSDIQFSDQPDRSKSAPFLHRSNILDQQTLMLATAAAKSDAKSKTDGISSTLEIGGHDEGIEERPVSTTILGNPVTGNAGTNGDLHTAAQHHYGSHYGSVKGHHGDYYQFAESHKKGQFHSGFKRGGKKFQVSGHASQHKSHAEGHVNWHGKKGKGVQYWDYKHKNKKSSYHDGYNHH